jgi:phosphatidylglycerophosphatase C
VQLAVFDLDGTVTRRDTLLPYVTGYLNRQRWWGWPGMLRVVPTVARYALGKADPGQLKASFIKSTLAGATRSELSAWTEKFVRVLLEEGLFGEARSKISAHREAGDRLVLMSASTDLYVPAVARSLGFHEVTCTAVRWDGERLRGDLATPNCRGPEKTRCLKELQQRYPDLPSVAYGNARSDIDHLQAATRGVLVNGSATARQMAAGVGVACVTWQ